MSIAKCEYRGLAKDYLIRGVDIKEIRRGNLAVLEAEAESLKAIGDAMVRALQRTKPDAEPPNYANVLSQHKGGKPIGDKIARLLEEAMHKKKGWMDVQQFAAIDEAMEAKEAAQLVMNMKPEDRSGWLRHGRLLAQQNPDRSNGNPFGDIPAGGKPKPGTGTQ